MQIENNELIISDDKSKLDLKLIHQFLKDTYWAKGRTVEEVKTSIENSLCFGVYINNQQIGFARVLTDKIIFAYLMDVFVLEKFRGQGISIKLLNYVFNHPELIDVKKWMLATSDAHSLYKKFGFEVLKNPNNIMAK